MKKVSYKKVLVNLYEDTDLQSYKITEPLLVRKLKYFDKQINGIYSLKLNKVKATVTDNCLDFPFDAFNIDFILLGDLTAENQYFINNSNEHYVTINVVEEVVDNETLYKVWSDLSFGTQYRRLEYIIADGKIQVDPCYEGEEITLFYTSYPLNEKGEFLVNENHTQALIDSIKHFVFERDMFKRKLQAQRLYNDDFGFIRELRSNKNLSIRDARVKDREMNEQFLNKDYVNIYNVLIENDLY